LEQVFSGAGPIIGTALLSLGRVLQPSALDSEIERWRTDVTRSLNSLEEAVEHLSGRVEISDLALEIGIHVSKESEEGIPEPVEIDQLARRFDGTSTDQIVEACGELEHSGVATLLQVIGGNGHLCPNVHFFETFDPFVFTWHPPVDAARLSLYVAEQSAATESTVGAEHMAEHFGWGVRRLNPALLMVAEQIGEERKFTGYAPPWACLYLYASPAERAALRSFARQILGEQFGAVAL
jgi:hypothetical protein